MWPFLGEPIAGMATYEPPAPDTGGWCRDCQLGNHSRCFEVTCLCEMNLHPALISEAAMARNAEPIPGDAFNRASGGG